MDFQGFKEAVIAQCKKLGIEEYELYYQTGESISVGVFQQEVNQFTAAKDGGVCFRCIVDGKMGYASTEALDPQEAVRVVETAVDNARVLESKDPVFLGEGGQCYEKLERELYPLPATEELIAAALDTQKMLYAADSMVVDGTSVQTLCERSEISIFNSKGLDLSYVNHVAGVVAVAVVSDGTQMSNDAQIKLGQLDTIDRAALAEKAAAEAVVKLGGESVPTGVYPVVFSPEAMADLLSTFRGIFSARRVQKGLSKLADMEGKAVASELVTVVDDPFHPQSPMPIPFDAEGTPTRRKAVVEKGVLQTLLYDLETANLAQKQTTGNAARGSYKSSVDIQPFSMYLASGTDTPEQVLEKAGNGVYIDQVTGLHAGANTVSGDLSLQSGGYLIENGKKTHRVKGFTVAGNFYELLKNITALGNDSHLPAPLGMTAFGAPTTLVQGLTVAGK